MNISGFRIKRHGQSMVEAVVVIGVVVMLVTGLVTATTTTLRSGQMSKSRVQALRYAKEGLEVVRIIKDADWNLIPQTSKQYCLGKGEQALVNESLPCAKTIDNTYSRTVAFADSGACTAASSCRSVTVTVTWSESGQDKSVALTSFLTNWRTTQ